MASLSLQWPCFELGPFRVGFVVDKVALEQVSFFSQYFGFPLPLLFNQYSTLIFIREQSLETFKVFVLWLSIVIGWFDFIGGNFVFGLMLRVARIAHEYQ